MVHRVIKAYLHGERELDPLDPAIEDLAGPIDGYGGRAAKAEALRKRTLTARWAQGALGEAYDGHVIAVKPFGAVVQLGTSGVTGVVPVESLKGGWRKQGTSWWAPTDGWPPATPSRCASPTSTPSGGVSISRSRAARRRGVGGADYHQHPLVVCEAPGTSMV